MPKDTILAIEDDPYVRGLYQSLFGRGLQDEFGFHLEATGEGGLAYLNRHPVDLLLLDWTLPDLSGLEVLKRVRSDGRLRGLPVFMVSAQNIIEQRVLAIETGADDYLVKPFVVSELTARVRALLRRRAVAFEDQRAFEVDDLQLEPRTGAVTVGGKAVHLAKKQLDLLSYFLKHPDMLHSAARLGEAVWGYETDSLQYHVSELRHLLGSKWARRLQTRRGEGYFLDTRLDGVE